MENTNIFKCLEFIEKCEIKPLNCNICEKDNCNSHCVICSKEEKCLDHSLETRINIRDNTFVNGYYTFLIIVTDNKYDLVPVYIDGKITTAIIPEKDVKFNKPVRSTLTIIKQFNLGKSISYLQDVLKSKIFKRDSDNKSFTELTKNIDKYEDTSCYFDPSSNEVKIYLDTCRYSIINFKCGNKYREIKLSSFISAFKKISPDLQNFFRLLNVSGVIFPYKITIKKDDTTLRSKISWAIRLTAFIEEGSIIGENNPQKHFEREVDSHKNIQELIEEAEEIEKSLLAENKK